MDAGIIASLKTRYRKQQLRHTVMLSDKGSSKPYDIDQLTAMKWTVKIWNEIPKSVHQNSWQHIKLVQQPRDFATSDDTSKICAEVQDEDIVECISMGNLIDSMTNETIPATVEQADDSGAEEPERPCSSLKDVNTVLALICDHTHYSFQLGNSLDVDLKVTDTLLESYKWKRINLKEQTSIRHFFKPS
ncbi:hypothetical protein K3495_g2225 [Podosphaera aphanis]|nr:hypothetical protein K3495_g2225 [Podosphaera aphanis]